MWSVTQNGTQMMSATAPGSIQFEDLNATGYTYTVGSVSGYTASPNSGTFDIQGADFSQTITFTAIPTYTVTFSESGLPGGTQWTATLGGTPQSTSSTSISFSGEPNGHYPFTISSSDSRYAPSPGKGSITVNGANPPTEDITFVVQDYPVTFQESGLPSGTSWSVTLQGTKQSSSTSSIVFSPGEPNGSYSFTVSSSNLEYTPSPGSGMVGVSGGPASQDITFSLLSYTVSFTEGGLPGGTTWFVTLNKVEESSSGNTITFNEPNGTYSYTVPSVNDYAPSPGSGKVTVNGASVGVTITFSLVTYTVTFTETGLPTGDGWSVTLNGFNNSASSSKVIFTEVNGSYPYTVNSYDTRYQPHPTTGTIVVAGKAVTKTVSFQLVTYTVTFQESGLISGTGWSITLNQQKIASNTQFIVFNEANGSYTYSVTGIFGWSPSSSGGPVSVTGAPQVIPITWTELLYTVTFLESGLPPSSVWSVDYNGTVNSSSSVDIGFRVPDGNYTYTVTPPLGFVAVPGVGLMTINGTNNQTTIGFYVHTYDVTYVETGLSPGTFWKISINGIVVPTNQSSVTIQEPNGSFTYNIPLVKGYTTTKNATGSVEVVGLPVTVNITFSAIDYTVEFEEQGLPQSSNWSITLNGVYRTSAGSSTITFDLANGTYNFTIGAVVYNSITKWTIGSNTFYTDSGNLTVNGRLVTVVVTYTPFYRYIVTFYETGLTLGTEWSVSIGSSTVYSDTNFTAINLPDGTWSYYLGSVTGYSLSVSSGLITVDGNNQSQHVVFIPTTGGAYQGPPKGFTEAELILIVSAVIAVVIIAFALFIRGRHPSGPVSTPEPASPEGANLESAADLSYGPP
jgi:hypothetical protein